MHGISRVFNVVEHKRIVKREKLIWFNLEYGLLCVKKVEGGGKRLKLFDASSFIKAERFSTAVYDQQHSSLLRFYKEVNQYDNLNELERYEKHFQAEESRRYTVDQMPNVIKFKGLEPTEDDMLTGPHTANFDANIKESKKHITADHENTGLRVTFQPFGSRIIQVVFYFTTAYDRESFLSLLLAVSTAGNKISSRFRALDQKYKRDYLTIEQTAALFFHLGLEPDDIFNGAIKLPETSDLFRHRTISYASNPALVALASKSLVSLPPVFETTDQVDECGVTVVNPNDIKQPTPSPLLPPVPPKLIRPPPPPAFFKPILDDKTPSDPSEYGIEDNNNNNNNNNALANGPYPPPPPLPSNPPPMFKQANSYSATQHQTPQQTPPAGSVRQNPFILQQQQQQQAAAANSGNNPPVSHLSRNFPPSPATNRAFGMPPLAPTFPKTQLSHSNSNHNNDRISNNNFNINNNPSLPPQTASTEGPPPIRPLLSASQNSTTTTTTKVEQSTTTSSSPPQLPPPIVNNNAPRIPPPVPTTTTTTTAAAPQFNTASSPPPIPPTFSASPTPTKPPKPTLPPPVPPPTTTTTSPTPNIPPPMASPRAAILAATQQPPPPQFQQQQSLHQQPPPTLPPATSGNRPPPTPREQLLADQNATGGKFSTQRARPGAFNIMAQRPSQPEISTMSSLPPIVDSIENDNINSNNNNNNNPINKYNTRNNITAGNNNNINTFNTNNNINLNTLPPISNMPPPIVNSNNNNNVNSPVPPPIIPGSTIPPPRVPKINSNNNIPPPINDPLPSATIQNKQQQQQQQPKQPAITVVNASINNQPQLQFFPEDNIPQNLKFHIYHHTLVRYFIIYLRTQQFFVSYFKAQQKLDEKNQNNNNNNQNGNNNNNIASFINNSSPSSPDNNNKNNNNNKNKNNNSYPISITSLRFSLENVFLLYADIVRLIAAVRHTTTNGIVITNARNTTTQGVDTSIRLPSMQHYLCTFETIFENKHIARLGKGIENDILLQNLHNNTENNDGNNNINDISTEGLLIGKTPLQSDNKQVQIHQLHAHRMYIQTENLLLLQSALRNNSTIQTHNKAFLIGEDLIFSSECGIHVPFLTEKQAAQGNQPHLGLVPATFKFTNYRIIITPLNNLYRTIEAPNWGISKFHFFLSNTTKNSHYPQDTTVIDFETKDNQRIRFYLDGQGVSVICELMKSHIYSVANGVFDAFAFKYRLGVINLSNQYRLKGNNLTEFEKRCFEKFKQSPICPESDGYVDGWSIFKADQEYKRQGLPLGEGKFALVENTDYMISPSYPHILAVPHSQVNNIYEICQYRSKNRFPIVTYYYKETGATISRCAQPLVGLQNKVSQHDINLINDLRLCNESNPEFYLIADARPYAAAVANKFGGKGAEKIQLYTKCQLTFFGIDNIHGVSASYRKLTSSLYPAYVDQAEVNEKDEAGNNGAATGQLNKILDAKKLWFGHISTILQGTIRIVEVVAEEKTSCVIRCSDSWDRTPQLTSLSMLILDPYYRTIDGFCVLIEKEWLSFGHLFLQRYGHGCSTTSSQRSPIFIQWIDCVYQIMHQYPQLFEFTSLLLIHIAESLYSCRYGTFLLDCEREREKYDLKSTTISLWSELLHPKNKIKYINSQYAPSPAGRIYYPDASGSRIVLFEELHLRYSPHYKAPPQPTCPGSYQPDQIKIDY